VILEIEKYASAHVDDAANDIGAVGRKELMADLEHADGFLEIGDEAECLFVVVDIERDDQTVSRLQFRIPFTPLETGLKKSFLNFTVRPLIIVHLFCQDESLTGQAPQSALSRQ
jgi:hypothetical protein